jgi:hypothetical protein
LNSQYNMARTKGDITKLVSAKKETDSLRTTVPSSIVRVMKLMEGDELQWEIKSMEKGLIQVTATKAATEKKLERKD